MNPTDDLTNIVTWVFSVRIPDSLCGTPSGETQMLGLPSWILQTATSWQSLTNITARCFFIQILVDWTDQIRWFRYGLIGWLTETTGQKFSGFWWWGGGTKQFKFPPKCWWQNFFVSCNNVNYSLANGCQLNILLHFWLRSLGLFI
jgi:hypothetical protein